MAEKVPAVPQFICDGLVPVDSNPRHLLEDSLSAEGVQAVDLQLRVPDVLQNLGRLVHFLIMNISEVKLLRKFWC